MIRTVLKDISKDDLGWCQCHEHIFIEDGPSKMINDVLYMNDYGKSMNEVFQYKAAGGHSFVDAQPYGCGRMGRNLIRLSEDTGVNIIGCTGFHKIEFLADAEMLERISVDEIAHLYISEIDEGMFSSRGERLNGRAGVIKCAIVKDGINACKLYSKLFKATAIAAAETKAPLMVHVDQDADALSVIDYFEKSGIGTNKIMICHLDRAKYDYKYHQEVAGTGVYLEYDTICRDKYHTNEKEVELISFMLSNGYADQIMLSLDTTNKRLKSYYGEIGLDYILLDFRKLLLRIMSIKVLDQLMIENPSYYLDFC